MNLISQTVFVSPSKCPRNSMEPHILCFFGEYEGKSPSLITVHVNNINCINLWFVFGQRAQLFNHVLPLCNTRIIPCLYSQIWQLSITNLSNVVPNKSFGLLKARTLNCSGSVKTAVQGSTIDVLFGEDRHKTLPKVLRFHGPHFLFFVVLLAPLKR